jgi:putative peptidoglycan lipid II flippase
MGPAVIAASAVQVNVLVNSGFAASITDASGHVIDGPVSWLNIAFRLMQLPLGIFGVAVGTVTLPLVSRAAAVGDSAGFRSALAHALRLVMVLTIPAAIGLMILARPIISVIYQHGRFSAFATDQTAVALQFYAIGLTAYAAVKILAPAFYAIDRRYLPMIVSMLSIITNFFLNWFFMFKVQLGHRGLALSTSIVALSNFLLLYIMMWRYSGSLETDRLVRLLGKLAVAGAVLGAISWFGLGFVAPGVVLWQKIVNLTVIIAAAAAAFFGVAFLLHVDEVREVFYLVKSRLVRPAANDE